MIDATIILKILGASLGSSIAVVFKPAGDSWFRLFQRFIIGLIIGFISSPVIMDWLEWEVRADYWIASAALGGLCGYLILQLLFSDATIEIIRKKVS